MRMHVWLDGWTLLTRTPMQVFAHPWFKTDLAKGMETLNYDLVQTLSRPGLQSVEEIERVVQQATQTQNHGWSANGAPPLLVLHCLTRTHLCRPPTECALCLQASDRGSCCCRLQAPATAGCLPALRVELSVCGESMSVTSTPCGPEQA